MAALNNMLPDHVAMIGMLPPMQKPPIKLDHTQGINKQIFNNISHHTIQLIQYVDSIFNDKLQATRILYISKFTGFDLRLFADLIHNDKLTYADQGRLSDIGERVFGLKFVQYMQQQGFNDFLPNEK